MPSSIEQVFPTTLGSQSMEQMHESRTANDVYAFLILLNRGLPQHQFCEDCRKLHRGRPGFRSKSLRPFQKAKFLGARHTFIKMLQVMVEKTNLSEIFWSLTSLGLWAFRLNWQQDLGGFRHIDNWYHDTYTLQHNSIFRVFHNTMFSREQRSMLLPWKRVVEAR